jgi:GNAT superfamily N-acetyltransferase
MSDTARVTIRSALASDAPAILRLINALAEYERLSDQVVATEADLLRWVFGDRPVAEVLVAAPRQSEPVNEELVGFALFFHNFSTFLGRPGIYLEDLFVVPDWRGRGVGRRLLASLAKVAVARGCGRLEWSVLDWNAPAIGFYHRLGAVVLNDWRICRMTGEALATLATHG